jgi:hypothetical protein
MYVDIWVAEKGAAVGVRLNLTHKADLELSTESCHNINGSGFYSICCSFFLIPIACLFRSIISTSPRQRPMAKDSCNFCSSVRLEDFELPHPEVQDVLRESS